MSPPRISRPRFPASLQPATPAAASRSSYGPSPRGARPPKPSTAICANRRQRLVRLEVMRSIARFIFWDFPRASWQYDVMVALILAFIFLTPREFFHDQPKAASVVMLPAEGSGGMFWIEPELLAGVPPVNHVSKAAALVNARFKTHT